MTPRADTNHVSSSASLSYYGHCPQQQPLSVSLSISSPANIHVYMSARRSAVARIFCCDPPHHRCPYAAEAEPQRSRANRTTQSRRRVSSSLSRRTRLSYRSGLKRVSCILVHMCTYISMHPDGRRWHAEDSRVRYVTVNKRAPAGVLLQRPAHKTYKLHSRDSDRDREHDHAIRTPDAFATHDAGLM